MVNGFSEIEQNAWGGFLGVYAHINRLVEEDLHSHSQITHVEFEILLRLSFAKNQRIRIQDLAAQSLLTRSGTSRAITRLEAAGLVTHEEASEDRRGAYAVLTKAGMERFRTAAEAHMDFVRKNFLSYFTEQELEQMTGFWRRFEKT